MRVACPVQWRLVGVIPSRLAPLVSEQGTFGLIPVFYPIRHWRSVPAAALNELLRGLADRKRAMRTDLVVFSRQGRVDETSFWFRLRLFVEGQSGWSVCDSTENPVRGVRADERSWLVWLGLKLCSQGKGSPTSRLCRFVQRGWRGELSVGDNRHRSNHFGDWVKRPAVKSSTMKGPIEYERKGLPVRFRGDGAESRKSVQERYPELLLS